MPSLRPIVEIDAGPALLRGDTQSKKRKANDGDAGGGAGIGGVRDFKQGVGDSDPTREREKKARLNANGLDKLEQVSKRHNQEMAVYQPTRCESDDTSMKLQAVSNSNENSIQAATGETSKKKKDPNAPKKVPGTYIFYQNAIRPTVTNENPNLTYIEITRIISQQWNAMSVKEKQPYDDMRNADKERYNREMMVYKPRSYHESGGTSMKLQAVSNSNENSIQAVAAKTSKKKKDPKAPKQVPGTYIFYQNAIRPTLAKENPDLAYIDITRIISQQWKSMSVEEKQPYDDMRLIDKERFEKETELYTANLRAEENGRVDHETARNETPPFHEQPMAVKVSIITEQQGTVDVAVSSRSNAIDASNATENDCEESMRAETSIASDMAKVNDPSEQRCDLTIEYDKENDTKHDERAKPAAAPISPVKPLTENDKKSSDVSKKIGASDRIAAKLSLLRSMKQSKARTPPKKKSKNIAKMTENDDISTASSTSCDSVWSTNLLQPKRGDNEEKNESGHPNTKVSDFANDADQAEDGNDKDWGRGDARKTHSVMSPTDDDANMKSFCEGCSVAAAGWFHDEETQLMANTKKKVNEKRSLHNASQAGDSTVSSTTLKLIPISKTECRALFRKKGISSVMQPEYLVPGSHEYHVSRNTITLQMMWTKDANEDVAKSVFNSSHRTKITLGRDTRSCKTTGIDWNAVSRNLCDVSLTNDRGKDLPAPIAQLIMRKSAREHAVCINGLDLNIPVGEGFRLKDGAVLSLYGPTGFAYQVKISHDDT